MVKAMTGSMNGAQFVISSREGCASGNLLISHGYALAAEGIHRYTKPFFEGKSSTDVIGMSMRDEDTANIATLCSLFYNAIKIGCIINRGINYRCPSDTAPQYYSVGTRSGHERRIGGQDNRIWNLHFRLQR